MYNKQIDLHVKCVLWSLSVLMLWHTATRQYLTLTDEKCVLRKEGGKKKNSNHPPDVTDVEAPEADAAFDGPKQGTPAGDAADHKWLQVTWHYSSSFHLWRGILERYRLCHDKREGQNALIQHCQRRNVQAAVCKKKIKVLLCYLILSRTSQCTVGRQWWQWFP